MGVLANSECYAVTGGLREGSTVCRVRISFCHLKGNRCTVRAWRASLLRGQSLSVFPEPVHHADQGQLPWGTQTVCGQADRFRFKFNAAAKGKTKGLPTLLFSTA